MVLVWQVSAATVHMEGLGSKLPVLVMEESVVAFLQGTTLLIGLIGSIILQRKLQAQPWNLSIPQTTTMFVLFTEMWYLIMTPSMAGL